LNRGAPARSNEIHGKCARRKFVSTTTTSLPCMSFPWLIISVEKITSPQQSSFEAHSFEYNTLWKLYPTGCKAAGSDDLQHIGDAGPGPSVHLTINLKRRWGKRNQQYRMKIGRFHPRPGFGQVESKRKGCQSCQ
jgi:hypothetical protein